MHARLALASIAAVAILGCGQSPETERDSGSDRDAQSVCGTDADCDDGVFCNGAERCAPDSGADARGCIAGDPPCPSTCDEASTTCGGCDVAPDADGDGHLAIACGGNDCDDTDANRYPGNTEVCDPDDRDEDCDPATFGVRDLDGDFYPDAACCNEASDGTRRCGTDCDDTRPDRHPGLAEACDATDNDCDGEIDEGLEATFYRDADMDGHGNAAEPISGVCAAPAGYVANDTDCNDASAASNPGAPEVCDGIDNDCDTMVDEDTITMSWYVDADGDGWGSATEPAIDSCRPIAGRVTTVGDCDDTNAGRNPGLAEVCDGIGDNDCNPATNPFDADLDGHDRADCGGSDCDDTDPTRYPLAPDLCDGIDNDCDPSTAPSDDMDGDGYLALAATCTGGPLASLPRTDCDDTSAAVHPGAPEPCNGVDDDCDSVVDGAPATAWCNDPSRALANASSTCVSGTCAVASCSAPWGDCDANSANGCETNTEVTLAHCGACGSGCTFHCLDAGCDDLVDIGGGWLSHACAVRASGAMTCWGANAAGQLGDGTTTTSYRPVAVVGVTGAVEASTGGTFSCARLSSGGVRCWGANAVGQLGNGTTSSGATPPVDVLGLTDAVQVVSGNEHTCARRASNQVVCWGQGNFAQMGDGGTSARSSPVNVSGLSDAIDADAGHHHSCAIRAGGQVVCWGGNDGWQLGNASCTTVSCGGNRPVEVTGLTDAIDVTAGQWHSCAIRAGGQVVCWGRNEVGQLGDGVSDHGATIGLGYDATRTPVNVLGLTDAVEIAAGSQHTCARRASGQVVCWGAGGFGQLGDGTSTDRPTPVNVSGLGDAVELDVGQRSGCARRTSGQAVCWGPGIATGTGSSSARPSPADVLPL